MKHFLFAAHVMTMCKDANIGRFTPVSAPLQTVLGAGQDMGGGGPEDARRTGEKG